LAAAAAQVQPDQKAASQVSWLLAAATVARERPTQSLAVVLAVLVVVAHQILVLLLVRGESV
jgi:hypothetical protein